MITLRWKCQWICKSITRRVSLYCRRISQSCKPVYVTF